MPLFSNIESVSSYGLIYSSVSGFQEIIVVASQLTEATIAFLWLPSRCLLPSTEENIVRRTLQPAAFHLETKKRRHYTLQEWHSSSGTNRIHSTTHGVESRPVAHPDPLCSVCCGSDRRPGKLPYSSFVRGTAHHYSSRRQHCSRSQQGRKPALAWTRACKQCVWLTLQSLGCGKMVIYHAG